MSETIRVLLNEEEVEALGLRGIRVLSRRNLESYLFVDEVINKLCVSKGRADLFPACLAARDNAIHDSIARGNPADDVKSASGPITVELKRILSLTQCGNKRESFIMNAIIPLFTPDMSIYQELEQSIFG